MKNVLTGSVFLLLTTLVASAQIATVTPSATTYSPAGGTLTFTVNLSYSGPHSALGFSIGSVPANWAYGVTGGVNIPDSPVTGDTGNFGFYYLTVPTSPASFTFTVTYPGGLTGNQTFSGITAIFRPAGSPLAVVNLPSVVIAPASASPTITDPLGQSYSLGSNISLVVTATGTPAPTIVWQKDGVELINGGRISGAATANLQIADAQTSDAGTYRAIASNGVGSPAVSNGAVLTYSPVAQTITFPVIGAKTFGDAPFALTATATSGLPVSYASSNANVATISGNTVTIVGAGNSTITASQAGNTIYAPAPNVPQTLVVNKATATIALGGLATNYDGTPKPATATTAPAGLSVAITYNGSGSPPTNPGSYEVSATITHPNYSGVASGTETIAITTLVRHAPVVNGAIDGSVQMLSGESVSLGGSGWISGDLLVPATPNVTAGGASVYGGTLDGTGTFVTPTYDISLSGKSLLRHVVRRTDPIALPTVAAPPPPVGTRNVSLSAPGESPGDFATIQNLSLNADAGLVTVPPGTYGSFSASGNSGFVLGVAGATTPAIYNFQSLSLNVLPGTAQLQIVGPVTVTLANGSLLNGPAGSAAHPEWLVLRVATGGVTISGNVRFNGHVVAPNSSITMSGNSVLFGTAIADRVSIGGPSSQKDPALSATSATSDERLTP